MPRSIPRLDLTIAWVIFVPLSYVPNFAPPATINFASLMLFWSFFSLTGIILCDQLVLACNERSLLQQTTCSFTAWVRLLSVGALSGLLLDGFAQWLGKLWIYPYWDEAAYGITFVAGFCAYWLAISESYLAIKALLRRWKPPVETKTKLGNNIRDNSLRCGVDLN